MKRSVFVLSNESKTLKLGSLLASVCIQRCLIFLNGNIGVGKSIFCKGFLHQLGYVGLVKSPTFSLMESYFLTNWQIYHFDFYRINSFHEIECIGIQDYYNHHSIFLVEWPKKNLGILSAADIVVNISYYNCEKSRKVIVEAISNLGQRMLINLSARWAIQT